MKKHFILLFMVVACFLNACSKSMGQFVENQEIQIVVDNFFESYKNESTNDALGNLFSTNKLFANNSIEVNNVKSLLAEQISDIGSYRGYEFIGSRKVANSIELYTYLVKYDVKPLRFTFIFYKALDKWNLFSFKFDDDIILELEDAGKVYLLDVNIGK